ncbi:MAG: export transporter ATP-binding protein [Symbiobacteriaceae bacterium]|nr:export transporter ATP-binding protein [Symbiobacteriaceae bacterium]
MIEARLLTKEYAGRRVVDSVSFAAQPGEILGLVGPNGAGKSTLLAMLAGVIRPTAGTVTVAGRSLAGAPGAVAGLVGYVPQEIALHPSLTVRDTFQFWAGLHRLERRLRAERIARAVDLMGLGDTLNARVHSLSGGTRRKLNVAVALLPDPPVLIMDEPTAGMDVQTIRTFVAFLRRQAAAGKTILYTTHSYDELERLCDRLLLVNRGQARFAGTPDGARAEAATRGLPGADRLSLADLLAALGGW